MLIIFGAGLPLLKTIVIGSNIRKIGAGTFYTSPLLEDVYYNVEEENLNITVENGGNQPFIDATKHYLPDTYNEE